MLSEAKHLGRVGGVFLRVRAGYLNIRFAQSLTRCGGLVK
jgi:hypothetical protein